MSGQQKQEALATKEQKASTAQQPGRNTSSEQQSRLMAAQSYQRAKYRPHTLSSDAIIALQRTVGNAAVTRLLQRREHEPEKSRPAPDKPSTSTSITELEARISTSKGTGSPLEKQTQHMLEQGLQADLSAVHVHTDAEADHLSRSIHATAFTTGTDIFFRSGAYQPNSTEGLHLLAHEATHVVQQASGTVAETPRAAGLSISHPDDRFEQAAEASADHMLANAAHVRQAAGMAHSSPLAPFHTPLQRSSLQASPLIQRHPSDLTHRHQDAAEGPHSDDDMSHVVWYIPDPQSNVGVQGNWPIAQFPPGATVEGKKRLRDEQEEEKQDEEGAEKRSNVDAEAIAALKISLIGQGFPAQWLADEKILKAVRLYLRAQGASEGEVVAEALHALAVMQEAKHLYYYIGAIGAERNGLGSIAISRLLVARRYPTIKIYELVNACGRVVKSGKITAADALLVARLFILGADSDNTLITGSILPCYEYFGQGFTTVVNLRDRWPANVVLKKRLLALLPTCPANTLPTLVELIQLRVVDVGTFTECCDLLKQCPAALASILWWACSTRLALGNTLNERVIAVNYAIGKASALERTVAQWVVATFLQADYAATFAYIVQGVASEDAAEERFLAIKQTGGNVNTATAALNTPFVWNDGLDLLDTTAAASQHIGNNYQDAVRIAESRHGGAATNGATQSGRNGMNAQLLRLLNHYRGLIRNLALDQVSDLLIYATNTNENYLLSIDGRPAEEQQWRELEIIIKREGNNPNDIGSYTLIHCQPR